MMRYVFLCLAVLFGATTALSNITTEAPDAVVFTDDIVEAPNVVEMTIVKVPDIVAVADVYIVKDTRLCSIDATTMALDAFIVDASYNYDMEARGDYGRSCTDYAKDDDIDDTEEERYSDTGAKYHRLL